MTLGEIASQISANTGINQDLLLAQMQHETTNGSSELAQYHHNYGGLKGVAGMKMADKFGHISFDSDEEYVNYASTVLPRFNIAGIDDLETYVQTLQDNGYFTDSYDNYMLGMKGFLTQNGVSGGFRQTPPVLDMNNIVVNNPDQNVTNTTNLRYETIVGLNTISQYVRDLTGEPLLLTGGAEWGYHSGDGKDFTHSAGWKADVWNDVIKGNTAGGKAFKEYVNSLGFSCNWEEDHWDIDFSGHDARDPQTPKLTFSSFGQATGMSEFLQQDVGYMSDPLNITTYNEQPVKTLGFWEALGENFMDSMTTTGVASVMQTLWGGIAHSGWKQEPVTQEDIDYVKQALPNDKEAQEYCLLNGLDKENIRWLVNQKLVDKQRKQDIAQWRAGNENIIQSFMMYGAGAAGYLADPLNLIPVGGALTKIKALSRLGEGVSNLKKVSTLSEVAFKSGLTQSAVTTGDNYLKEKYGGEKVHYAQDALLAFLGGSILAGGGGYLNMMKKGKLHAEIAQKADTIESEAILHAVDPAKVDMVKVRSETLGTMLSHHDTSFTQKVKSGVYSKLEANQRVIATTYETARKAIADASGIDIPSKAKAIYVPNEDYTILLTDRINPKEVDRLLAHEVGVHGGLKQSLGDTAYQRLMNDINKQAAKEGTVYHEAMRQVGSFDPEEILAKLVEEGKLPDGMWSKLKGYFNKGFKAEGYNVHLDMKHIQQIMKEQVEAKRNPTAFHMNEDGSTAFAGIRYSQDNIMSPVRLAEVYSMEDAIKNGTPVNQHKALRAVSNMLEQGIFGLGIKSMSNTLRKYTPRIWEDAQGRGMGDVKTIPAETHKLQIEHRLEQPMIRFFEARQKWLSNQGFLKQFRPSTSDRFAYNKEVVEAYNLKYGGNKASRSKELSQFDKEVMEGVEALHEYRKLQIEIGKTSSESVGSKYDNLIDKDWYEVDGELWRITDRERVDSFIGGNFRTTEDAVNFLSDYFRTFAKKDVIKEKILRGIKMSNKKLREQNDVLKQKYGAEAKLKELRDEVVTDADVEAYLNKHIPNAVKSLLEGVFDPVHNIKAKDAELGKLSFLQERIPCDTSGIMKLENGMEFSFDNNLRTYDLDDILMKNKNRFAGECALKAVFKSDEHLKNTMAKVERELQTAKGKPNGIRPEVADREYREFSDAIDELRGVRPESADYMGRFGAFLRMFRNVSYASNGANMGFNQLGELGHTVAYGGIKQLPHVIPPLGRFMDRLLKADHAAIQEVDDIMFGRSLDSQVFTHNWRDMATRNALTTNGITDRFGRNTADVVQALGKYTSAMNMLPKMTEGMIRAMRSSMISDSIREACGKSVKGIRNPFSEAKLKAAHVSLDDWKHIKDNILKYAEFDGDKLKKLDVEKWRQEDVISYQKWYNLIQLQAERGIVSSKRQGNKNLLKNTNQFTQILFQFKDFSLRSMTSQTLRAMRAQDRDDLMATVLSIMTNLVAYGARVGATYGAYKAVGADKKAEEYYDYMVNQDNLMRVVATRSTILGTPLSFGNDIMEAWTGKTSIRTTVDRKAARSNPNDTPVDHISTALSQLPAFNTMSNMWLGGKSVYDVIAGAEDDKFTKRDLKNIYKAIPIGKMFALPAFVEALGDGLGLPAKEPKKR